MNIQMRVPAIVSIAFASGIVISFLLFKSLQSRRYVQLVFCVSICDIIGAVGVGLGDASPDTVSCWFQAFLTNFGFLAGVFWNTVIAYHIYEIVHRRYRISSLLSVHLICWGLALCLTILPLTTNSFGKTKEGYCFITESKGEKPNHPLLIFWCLFSFFFWLWLSIFCIIYLYLKSMFHLRSLNDDCFFANIMRQLYVLILYPFVLIICWVFPTIVLLYYSITGSMIPGPSSMLMMNISMITPAIQGFLLSVIFFAQNEKAREEWKCFLTRRTTSSVNNNQHQTGVNGLGGNNAVWKDSDTESYYDSPHQTQAISHTTSAPNFTSEFSVRGEDDVFNSMSITHLNGAFSLHSSGSASSNQLKDSTNFDNL